MRVAFAGNPNSGKTTMYNALTGKNERVGNWAGVTVDKKEALIKKSFCEGKEIKAVDLPGAYSMSPFTSEESITSEYIKKENPDVIINIVDATNLSRSLFFTTQLLELGVPVVVALNKSDVNEKKKTAIDTAALSKLLNCPVVETVSTSSKNEGLKEVVAEAMKLSGKAQKAPYLQDDIDLTDRLSVETADRKRFEFVNSIVSKVETRKVHTNQKNFQDKIDSVLTNRWLGIPIFAVVMFLVFHISQAESKIGLGVALAGVLEGWIGAFTELVSGWMEGSADILQAIVLDGIIGGVGAVLGFLPLVMVMYFLIALLEDCGYMARVSVVLDPIFKKVGLSGKSVIPFVIGTGCAIPGVMACRTIRNERERRATAMLAPFMPCGAKLPVIALFAGVFFKDASWVGTLMYFMGIAIIFFGALLINKITGYKHRKSFFIIELPEYKIPSFKRAFLSMCSRGWSYIVKAGTIILVCNAAVTIMQNFTWSFNVVAEGKAETSILATIAKPISYVLIPVVGIKAWQLAAAAVTGFIAKENVVGTIAIVYPTIAKFINEDLEVSGGSAEIMAAMNLTKVAALAYLMFNLFTPPCFAAIGAMNAEMKSKKWLWGGIALQFAVGFTVSFAVYQIGTLIYTGSVGAGFFPGLLAIIAFGGVIGYLIRKNNKKSISINAKKEKLLTK
ncbi:MAG: ferrous iron transport protein B [Clostridia bacterium]|nr:ferrous iron transport protein B [Clostridia bacterium]